MASITLVGQVSDAAGNAVRVTRTLTITEGGIPRADVAGGEIDWQGEMNRIVLALIGRQTLLYHNRHQRRHRADSYVWPVARAGRINLHENSNTLALKQHDDAWLQQAGVWRFGINFDTTGVDFPFRWAVGRQEDLERRMVKGHEQWYLLPGKSGKVSGCIVINEAPPVGTCRLVGRFDPPIGRYSQQRY